MSRLRNWAERENRRGTVCFQEHCQEICMKGMYTHTDTHTHTDIYIYIGIWKSWEMHIAWVCVIIPGEVFPVHCFDIAFANNRFGIALFCLMTCCLTYGLACWLKSLEFVSRRWPGQEAIEASGASRESLVKAWKHVYQKRQDMQCQTTKRRN